MADSSDITDAPPPPSESGESGESGDRYKTPPAAAAASPEKGHSTDKDDRAPQKTDEEWSLGKSLGELTRETRRDFFNRSDRTVYTLAKVSLTKLHPDTRLILGGYMNALIDVSKRELADATPMRCVEIKYSCPVLNLGPSRDLPYVVQNGIYYTVFEHEIEHIANVLRHRIRQKYGAKNDPERFIEVVVRAVPKTWSETMSTLPTTRVIEVLLCNVTQVYPIPPISSKNYRGAGINTV